jgi:hypothetical protein
VTTTLEYAYCSPQFCTKTAVVKLLVLNRQPSEYLAYLILAKPAFFADFIHTREQIKILIRQLVQGEENNKPVNIRVFTYLAPHSHYFVYRELLLVL